MEFWNAIKAKRISPSKFLPNPKILSSQQILPCQGWRWLDRTLPRESWHTTRQCPRTTSIPAIHHKPANLTRIHYSKLCRRYRCNSHRQGSSYCLTQTTNQPAYKSTPA
jgi:hypothetical protein